MYVKNLELITAEKLLTKWSHKLFSFVLSVRIVESIIVLHVVN